FHQRSLASAAPILEADDRSCTDRQSDLPPHHAHYFPDRFPRPGRAAALGAACRFVLRGMVLEEVRCKAPKNGGMAADLARDTQHHRLGAPDTNSIPYGLAALEIPSALSRPRHR